MLPLILLQVPEGVCIWLPSSEICIGNWFNSVSHLRQQFWHTSVSTACLLSIYSPTAGWCQHVPVTIIFALHSSVNCWFHEQQQNTATAVSPFKVLEFGTACWLNCEFQTLILRHSENDWRSFCLTHSRTASVFAALFNDNLVLYKCP